MSFAARYPGVCAACGERFPEGAEIEYTDDDELIHAYTCPRTTPTALDVRPDEVLCLSCWTFHVGECL